jgi:hypothetical protein
MKKIILVLAVILSLTSCQPVFNAFEDKYLESSAVGHTLYHLPEFDTLDTYSKIAIWIRAHTKYDYTYSDVETWNNPKDTIESGIGTCADFAVLYLNIAHYGMHEDGEIVCGTYSVSRSVESGGDVNHAQVRFGNIVIDPRTGNVSDMPVGYAYSFDEVF